MVRAHKCEVGEHQPQEITVARQQVKAVGGIPMGIGLEELIEPGCKGDIVDLADRFQVGYRVRRDGGNGRDLGTGNGADFFYSASAAS